MKIFLSSARLPQMPQSAGIGVRLFFKQGQAHIRRIHIQRGYTQFQ